MNEEKSPNVPTIRPLWKEPQTILSAALLIATTAFWWQANGIMNGQKHLMESQNRLAETQAVVSLVAGLELERPVGNDLKIAMLSSYGRRGYDALLDLATRMNFAYRLDPAIELAAFKALFSQGSTHDAKQVEETLNAWTSLFDPGIAIPEPYAAGALDLAEARQNALYMEPSCNYLGTLTQRFRSDETFRIEVRRRLLGSRSLVPGLAALHHAFLKHAAKLDKEAEAQSLALTLTFGPPRWWHVCVYDFAYELRGDSWRETPVDGMLTGTREWSQLGNLVTDDDMASQRKLREAVARWFPRDPERGPKPLGAIQPVPAKTPGQTPTSPAAN